jgi:hypothetical protein
MKRSILAGPEGRGDLIVPVIAAMVILAPIVVGVNAASGGSFRDRSDVFAIMMLAPVSLILPLVVALLTCLRLYARLAERFVANTRSRMSARGFVLRHMARAAGISALIFFLYAFAAFVAAFSVWPMVGDPGIDPAGYNMTAAQAAAESLERSSYSFLLGYGELAFGVGYAVWVSLSSATFAVLCCCFLVTLPNRILALGLPFLIYLGSTVGAALIGLPRFGLLYSLFPFGLEASAPLIAAAPMLVLAAVTLGFAALVLHRAPTNGRLA